MHLINIYQLCFKKILIFTHLLVLKKNSICLLHSILLEDFFLKKQDPTMLSRLALNFWIQVIFLTHPPKYLQACTTMPNFEAFIFNEESGYVMCVYLYI
jgi:hypothetical protein